MEKNKGSKERLSPELLRSVDQFIRENYGPESAVLEAEPEENYNAEIVWKGADLGGESFQEERIELKDGKPVLTHNQAQASKGLKDVVDQVGETFQQRLLRLIDERGLTDTEVYKRAHIDRKLFSKIRCNEDYTPRKKNVIALAIALHLNLDETVDLLRRAEMALSPSSKSDLIIEYCIRNKIYDINTVNDLLDQYGQEILG